MNVLDLFSGIGGFSLGLERAGMRTVAFCEIDPFARRVLAKHWPGVPCFDDVRTVTAGKLQAAGISVDVICGGFPCQDISDAGTRIGIAGARSGLWSEYARIIGEVGPSFVIVENVAALLGRGLGVVLGDLAALGYDAEWHCIPAFAVGAPHRRDRVWIVAYPDDARQCPNSGVRFGGGPHETRHDVGRRGSHVAYSECGGLQSGNVERARSRAIVPAAFGRHCGGSEFGAPWRIEPDVGRVAYGLPDAMDRLKTLGNAVVPQIPEIIGRAIMRGEL